MFDPYLQWMCIPKGPRPPTHYQLLGIAPDERDAEVIKEAALRQTTQVRVYQTGPQGTLCTRLLNEIAEARAVLLNPHMRDEYDAQRMEPQATPGTTIPVMSPLATSAFENRSRPVAVGRTQGRPAGSRGAALCYFLLVLAGAGASFWLSYDRLKKEAHVQPGPGKARVPAPGDRPR